MPTSCSVQQQVIGKKERSFRARKIILVPLNVLKLHLLSKSKLEKAVAVNKVGGGKKGFSL